MAILHIWNSVVFEGRNELVFEQRNKKYGAYIIRKRYSNAVIFALLGAVSFLMLVLSIPIVASWIESIKPIPVMEENKDVIYISNLPINEIKPLKTVLPPPLEKIIKNTSPEIKPEEKVHNAPPPSQIDLQNSKFDSFNQDGVTSSEIPLHPALAADPASDQPLYYAEQMAEFPGGEEAMMKFIQGQCYFTAIARELEIQGVVYLSFVIDKEGKVNDIKILKDIGGDLGNVAVKAVKQMPTWKPGRQNGRAVSLQFTVPVKFSLKN
jgi:protein TonB